MRHRITTEREGRTRFHMPGHKGKLPPYLSINMDGLFARDITELADTDDLYAPSGNIMLAQRAAARSAGASDAFFLTNGATAGIEAALIYHAAGGRVIMPRASHMSAVSACVLGGIEPVLVDEDEVDGFTPPNDAPFIDAILNAPNDIRAVFITSPRYDGCVYGVERLAAAARSRGLPLIVDEAHGAHFNWWDVIPSAGKQGVSAWVQSFHKTLPAPTQTACLFVNGDVDARRMRDTLRMVQTSSPSYLLMDAIDACREYMDTHGRDALDRLLDMLSMFDMLLPSGVYDPREVYAHDPTRIVLDVSRLGLTGFDALARLSEMGVDAEYADTRRVGFITTISDGTEDFDRLSGAIFTLVYKRKRELAGMPTYAHMKFPSCPKINTDFAMSPRDAFFAGSRSVALEESIGSVACRSIGVYPPGCPTIWPGEIITREAVIWLAEMRRMGAHVFGVDDGGVAIV